MDFTESLNQRCSRTSGVSYQVIYVPSLIFYLKRCFYLSSDESEESSVVFKHSTETYILRLKQYYKNQYFEGLFSFFFNFIIRLAQKDANNSLKPKCLT